MRVSIVGGGPAGLYFALLMKKREPSRTITVCERNGPDDTFGWGVVFSDKTLSYLEENDAQTYVAITNSFEKWDNVDVVHLDQKVTIRGNKFSGIARLALLHILQERCRAVGVNLLFNSEVDDLSSISNNCDLLVGADGVNSTVRDAFKDFFQPSFSVRPNKYIWYGTNRLFDGLTLTFRKNRDGQFAAHSYKFNKSASTFIVECDNDTWEKAKFSQMTDVDTRGYLAMLFANDLLGSPLLSNNSKWINFVNVKNLHWSYENKILLGDALHTAHFSIGSGTKLALEDAIALAGCFDETGDVCTALMDFERKRKPIIEEYQNAAFESLIWFENLKAHMHLNPLLLAFSLMTRSRKIDYENLKRRDPTFIAAYEAARDSQTNIANDSY